MQMTGCQEKKKRKEMKNKKRYTAQDITHTKMINVYQRNSTTNTKNMAKVSNSVDKTNRESFLPSKEN